MMSWLSPKDSRQRRNARGAGDGAPGTGRLRQPAQRGRPGGRGRPLLPFAPGEMKARREAWLHRTRDVLPGMARSFAMIALGCLVMAAGYSYFLIPQRIAPGGVYGLATVVHYASRDLLGYGLPTGLVSLVFNIPLFLWGLRSLGMRFASRTVFGIILGSAFIDLLTYTVPRIGWQPEIEALDPMLACIFGGLAVGAGLGLIFRHMGSTGGTDIVGQILGRKTNITVGVWMMIVDAFVVLLAVYYFRSLSLALYAAVTIFVTGRVIDSVIEGRSHSRAVTIISEKLGPIREAILFGLSRTGTLIEGTGLYRGTRKNVILCVVNRKELMLLEKLVAEVDPEAFLVVSKAHEVLGEGFKPLKERLEDG